MRVSALERALTEAYVGKDRNIHHAELNPEWLENGDNSGYLFERRALRQRWA